MRWHVKKRICLLLLSVILILVAAAPGYALTENDRKVLVAFPIQTGLTFIDDDGNYSGYTY